MLSLCNGAELLLADCRAGGDRPGVGDAGRHARLRGGQQHEAQPHRAHGLPHGPPVRRVHRDPVRGGAALLPAGRPGTQPPARPEPHAVHGPGAADGRAGPGGHRPAGGALPGLRARRARRAGAAALAPRPAGQLGGGQLGQLQAHDPPASGTPRGGLHPAVAFYGGLGADYECCDERFGGLLRDAGHHCGHRLLRDEQAGRRLPVQLLRVPGRLRAAQHEVPYGLGGRYQARVLRVPGDGGLRHAPLPGRPYRPARVLCRRIPDVQRGVPHRPHGGDRHLLQDRGCAHAAAGQPAGLVRFCRIAGAHHFPNPVRCGFFGVREQYGVLGHRRGACWLSRGAALSVDEDQHPHQLIKVKNHDEEWGFFWRHFHYWWCY
mmetsp:Transcript_2180/g.3502  ORF Transcript_2180/g.3502 Transcript_2180/m.3502 type:complete len:377 (-) Transcript_2180:660-1790(-)